jgi:hypothetical protein
MPDRNPTMHYVSILSENIYRRGNPFPLLSQRTRYMVWIGLINGLRLFTASLGSDDYISSATIITQRLCHLT